MKVFGLVTKMNERLSDSFHVCTVYMYNPQKLTFRWKAPPTIGANDDAPPSPNFSLIYSHIDLNTGLFIPCIYSVYVHIHPT